MGRTMMSLAVALGLLALGGLARADEPRDGGGAATADNSSAKTCCGFSRRNPAISARNTAPKSRSFTSPTPLMRRNSFSFPG